MAVQYELTGKQVAVLRALNEGIVEMSAPEVAVGGLLQLEETRESLETLKNLALVTSSPQAAGHIAEQRFELTGDGQKVYRALAQYKGNPPVGTTIRIPRPFPIFSGWLSGRKFSSYVQIIPDEERNGG